MVDRFRLVRQMIRSRLHLRHHRMSLSVHWMLDRLRKRANVDVHQRIRNNVDNYLNDRILIRVALKHWYGLLVGMRILRKLLHHNLVLDLANRIDRFLCWKLNRVGSLIYSHGHQHSLWIDHIQMDHLRDNNRTDEDILE